MLIVKDGYNNITVFYRFSPTRGNKDAYQLCVRVDDVESDSVGDGWVDASEILRIT